MDSIASPLPEIICLGELLIDFVSMDQNRSLSASSGFLRAPGGAPANVAVGTVRLGGSAGFIGKVGQDPFGAYLKQVLGEMNVDVQFLLEDPDARTTLSFVAQKSNGVRDCIFYRHPGADMLLRPDELDKSYFANAKVFHYGSISFTAPDSEQAALQAIQFAKEAGALLSYDPNYRPDLWPDQNVARQKMQSGLDYADFVKISEEEMTFITGETTPEGCGEFILKRGPRAVAVTLGEKGCYYTDGTASGYRSGIKSCLVDSTGAGDAFTAAMLYRFAQKRRACPGYLPKADEEFRQWLAFANGAGAIAVTKIGAIPSLPTRDEVLALLSSAGVIAGQM